MDSHRRVVQLGTADPVQLDAPSRLDVPASATVPRDAVAEQLERRNRAKPRSRELLDAIARLDTEPDALARQQIMEWIRKEYDERGGGELLGLFSRCYLGAPYVDHAMTVAGYICEHYRRGDPVPALYNGARSLAANPAYEYVEIYGDGGVVPIRGNGTV